MATSNTDSYIPSTKEYQVLQKYFGKLTYAITDPVRLAADMFADNLISDSTRIKANNETSSQEARNHHIVNDLLIAVVIDPANFIKIISVLQRHRPFLCAIAEKMITDYNSKTNFIYSIPQLQLFLQRCQVLSLQMNNMY